VHVRAARFPGSPLWLRFGRAGAHVKSFRWVILGCPCQLVQASRSGEGMLGRTSLYKKC